MAKPEFVSGLPGPDLEQPEQTPAGIIARIKHPVNRRDRERRQMKSRYTGFTPRQIAEATAQARRRYGGD